MSSSTSKKQRRASVRRAGQRLTAVLAAAALSAGSAVALAPAASAANLPAVAAVTDEPVEVDVLARPYLLKGINYTAGDTITANPGIWEKGAALSYRWLKNGETVEGETGLSLKLGADDTWSVFQFEVTASLEGRITVSDWSVPTREINPAPVQNFTQPVITGDAVPGSSLALDPGTWTEGSELEVQWLRNGEPAIYGYPDSYPVTDEDLGAVISAQVTGSEYRHTPLTAQANSTAAVVPADVVISGSNIPGSALTAVPGAWANGRELDYEWFIDGVSTGYTGAVYGINDDDGGHEITVMVNGTPSIHALSKPLALQAVVQSYDEPFIDGETVEGRTLTAVPGRWTDGAKLSYQWLRNGTAIPGATGAAYRLAAADSGARMTVSVTGTRSGHLPLTRTSWWAGPVTTDPVEPLEDAVMTGEPFLGRTLSVTSGVWPKGTANEYQWYRNGVTPIPGATGTTYKLTREDLGMRINARVRGSLPDHKSMVSRSNSTTTITMAKVANTKAPFITGSPVAGTKLYVNPGTWTPGTKLTYQWISNGSGIEYGQEDHLYISDKYVDTTLKVKVTGTLNDHTETVVYTAPSSVVTAPPVTNTKAPVLSGSAVRGQVLTVNPGTWTDKAELSYVWLRSGTPIPGALGSTYTPAAEDVGARISVKVTGTLKSHRTLSVTTGATAAVVNPQLTAGAASVSGTPVTGAVLTAAPGTWPKNTAFTYQWMRAGKAISGATAPAYTLTAADSGARISVKVTGSLFGYIGASSTSAETAAVSTPVITAPAAVSVTGNLFRGQTLTAVPGTWSKGVSLGYQWYAGGTAVTGATKSTLLLGPAHTGKAITVKITGTLSGAVPVTRTSTATKTVGMYTVANTVKPAVTGTPVTGQTLKVTPGTWTKGAALTYQWKADGKNIAGATASSYKLADAEKGKAVSVTVTGSLADYTPASVTTAATAKVTRPGVSNTVKPSVTGSAVQGQTLTAVPGTWTKGAAPAYQWKADGKDIAGARSASFKLTSAQYGKAVSVTVTASLAGYEPLSITSAATAKVTRSTVANTAAPKLTGNAVAGSTLQVSSGTWTKGAVVGYKWLRNGAAVPGAVKASYAVTAADAGKVLSVEVTGTLADFNPRTVTLRTAAVKLPAVTVTGTPAITGTLTAGSTLKLSSAGKWAAGTKLTYQWMRGDTAVKGATAATYKLVAADRGKAISVKVTGSKAGHTAVTVVSKKTAAVR